MSGCFISAYFHGIISGILQTFPHRHFHPFLEFFIFSHLPSPPLPPPLRSSSHIRHMAWHPHEDKLAIALRDDEVLIKECHAPSDPRALRLASQKQIVMLAWRCVCVCAPNSTVGCGIVQMDSTDNTNSTFFNNYYSRNNNNNNNKIIIIVMMMMISTCLQTLLCFRAGCCLQQLHYHLARPAILIGCHF